MVPWPEIDPECTSPPLARATEGIDRQQVDAMFQRQTAKSQIRGKHLGRSRQISADLGRSRQISADLGRSRQIAGHEKWLRLLKPHSHLFKSPLWARGMLTRLGKMRWTESKRFWTKEQNGKLMANPLKLRSRQRIYYLYYLYYLISWLFMIHWMIQETNINRLYRLYRLYRHRFIQIYIYIQILLDDSISVKDLNLCRGARCSLRWSVMICSGRPPGCNATERPLLSNLNRAEKCGMRKVWLRRYAWFESGWNWWNVVKTVWNTISVSDLQLL